MDLKRFIRPGYWYIHDKFNEAYYYWHRNEYDIMKFKNKYKGRACFVIGNGPSLRSEDLEKIQEKGFVTFAANKIYNIFKSTSWRPNYIAVSDPQFIRDKKTFKQIQNVQAEMLFVRSQFAFDIRNCLCAVCPIRSEPSRALLDNPMFSRECDKIIYDIGTVTYFSIQIAAYMGFKTIYLIGVDNKYAYSKLRDGTIIKNEGVVSYFAESGETIPAPSLASSTWESDIAYEYAENYSKEQDFRILNATRGGFLEIFERVNLDDVIG